MKRFSEQLNKKSLTVKLRAAEKRELRERVVSYMEYHPLPKEMKQVQTGRASAAKALTEEYQEVAVPFASIARLVAGFALVVLMVVPFAAERSVPGDTLYAVKHFNEEVRGTLAFNTIQKVEWETERLNRRIAEARLLASEGRLTDAVEAEVAEAVRTHSENAQKSIEVLRTEDADEATLASIALETNLAVQSAALHDQSEVNNTNNSTGEEVEVAETPSILATVVDETRAKAIASNASSTLPSFDKVMAKVEINTTRAYELLGSLTDTAAEEEVAEVTRRLEDIERTIAEAIALRADEDDTARLLLVDSLQRTQKLIVFMTDIDVSQGVDIEEIVPVVLTDDEEKTILNQLQVEIEEQVSVINQALLETEDVEVAEKSEAILQEIETILSETDTNTEFDIAVDNLNTALDLAQNIYILLEISQIEQDTEEVVPEAPVEGVGTTTEATASSTEAVSVESETEDETEFDEEITPVEEDLTEVEAATTTTATTSLSTEQFDTE